MTLFLICPIRCPLCECPVHAICGAPVAGTEEGFGQPRWCSKTGACSKVVLASYDKSCIPMPDSESDLEQSDIDTKTDPESEPDELQSFLVSSIHKSTKGKLTEDQKLMIVNKKHSNPSMAQKQIISWFTGESGISVSQSTISDVLKRGQEKAFKGNLTLENRKNIFEQYVNGPKRTQKELAQWAKKP